MNVNDNLKFKSADEMVKFLKGLKPSDHYRMAKAHGIKPKDHEEAHLSADYVVQGIQKGLSGEALVAYVQSNVARLQSIMPHLKAKPQVAPVVKPTKATKPVTKKRSVAPSTPKPATPKRIKYEDFTIVYRADRGGYEGWYGGKAEAFRETQEKVQTFFQKKYQRTGAFKVIK